MAAKRKADLAQAGKGDPTVVALPGYRKLPDPLYPLRTVEGRQEYDLIGTKFFDAGKFTMDVHRSLSEYAIQVDALHDLLARNEIVRASRFDKIRQARTRLNLDGIDEPIAAPESAPVNKFAGCGFSARRR